ncbi:MAG: hypothetical protein M1131_06370 [Actinobacteria bacterium]|jgi:hypothetical protein|nr:hypothetical protein [Actinomycetota bacterium]MCL6094216.1 hypothetical protein [Actinomycetota bacterium]
MKRRTFDALLTSGGIVLTLVLIVAGALLMVGASFAASNVHNQLAEQDIFFPPRSAFAHAKPGTEITPGMKPYLLKYAGEQVLTGGQAEAYANHFIAVHLSEMPYGGVYSKVSAAARAHPKNAKLQALVNTVFEGTTLRGLLLEAYGFGIFGTIALYAGIASFALAFIMLILTVLGFVHLRRVTPDEELAIGTKVLSHA